MMFAENEGQEKIIYELLLTHGAPSCFPQQKSGIVNALSKLDID